MRATWGPDEQLVIRRRFYANQDPVFYSAADEKRRSDRPSPIVRANKEAGGKVKIGGKWIFVRRDPVWNMFASGITTRGDGGPVGERRRPVIRTTSHRRGPTA